MTGLALVAADDAGVADVLRATDRLAGAGARADVARLRDIDSTGRYDEQPKPTRDAMHIHPPYRRHLWPLSKAGNTFSFSARMPPTPPP
jgi:hypothetical protein